MDYPALNPRVQDPEDTGAVILDELPVVEFHGNGLDFLDVPG